jgi:S1-C subfamily serine protease
MKTKSLLILANAALLAGASAQRSQQRSGDIDPDSLVRPEEVRAVQDQTRQLFDAIRPASQAAVESTVWVWANTGRGSKPVSFGTVIDDGTKVVTKWSEIAMAKGSIQVVGGDGMTAKAKVVGVYQEDDLALLQLEGPHFRPVTLTAGEAPKLGRFLVAASPDDTPASVGVVAVEARSLREQDQAFLGIIMDPQHKGKGVMIQEVVPEGGAADAGLKAGDIIFSIGSREVNSLFEMKNALSGRGPGERLDVHYTRKGSEASVQVELKAGKKTANFEFPNARLRVMERMGTELSLVRTGFPSVIQTDMQLDRKRCGGPVVDLEGNVVGVAIARADRTRSFIIPTAHLKQLLAKAPVTPEEAQAMAEAEEEQLQAAMDEAMPRRPQGAPRAVPIQPGAADRLRRNLEDMSRLMEKMRAEMESIEE